TRFDCDWSSDVCSSDLPNIVVSTGPDAHGFVENDWIEHTVAIGDDVQLRITGGCPRCVMTTLPQGDLPRDPGILRTAAQHNHARSEERRVGKECNSRGS